MKLGIQLVAECGVYLQLLAQISTNQSTHGCCRGKQKVYLLQEGAMTTGLITGPSGSLYIFGCRCQQSYSLRPRVPWDLSSQHLTKHKKVDGLLWYTIISEQQTVYFAYLRVSATIQMWPSTWIFQNRPSTQRNGFSFKLFNCNHKTKCLHCLEHRTYNINRYNTKTALLT